MEIPSYFTDFLKDIRPTSNHIDDYKRGHHTLRGRLEADEELSPIIVSTFLQGSYRRATAIKPNGGTRADVDIIVVTNLSQDDYTPEQALKKFVPFLKKHYDGKYRLQGRSIGIELSYVDMDLVITSAPCEAEREALKSDSVTTESALDELSDWRFVKSWVAPDHRSAWNAGKLLEAAKREAEWQLSPLYIPDRHAQVWEPTHPLAQIHWTWDKNAACNGHYVNVVKAIKWWRRVQHPEPKHPKGYPLEHLIGACCPDSITSVAEGVTLTLEKIRDEYQAYADNNLVPTLWDHGVQQNVFSRITAEDFSKFHSQVCDAAELARTALDATTIKDSAEKWRKLFGSAFPEYRGNGNNGESKNAVGGFTPRKDVTTVGGGRFA